MASQTPIYDFFVAAKFGLYSLDTLYAIREYKWNPPVSVKLSWTATFLYSVRIYQLDIVWDPYLAIFSKTFGSIFSTISIIFLTAISIRSSNNNFPHNVTRLFAFSSYLISSTSIEAIDAAVRGGYDGPFFDPLLYGNTIGATSSFSLFNYSSLLEACFGGTNYPLEF